MERDIDVIRKPGEDFIVPFNMYAKELPHDSFDPIVIPMTLFVVHAFSVRTRIGAEVPRAFNVATAAEVPCSVALLVLDRARLAESCCAEDDSSVHQWALPVRVLLHSLTAIEIRRGHQWVLPEVGEGTSYDQNRTNSCGRRGNPSLDLSCLNKSNVSISRCFSLR